MEARARISVKADQVVDIPVTAIEANFQPRIDFDEETMAELISL